MGNRKKTPIKLPYLRILVSLLLFFICHQVSIAYPQLLNQKYIIDTDCATDDFRAISFLLSRPEIEISAIVVSQGTLEPRDGGRKVKSLLCDWGKQSIPVLCNSSHAEINPSWREFNLKAKWGSEEPEFKCEDYMTTLTTILKSTADETYTLLCLASLSTAANLLDSNPQLIKKIKRIIWYTKSFHPLQGFNYNCDKKAADKILKSDNIRVDIISNAGMDNFIFTSEMINLAEKYDNPLAKKILTFHTQPEVMAKVAANHFVLKDELAALYILSPELFDMNIRPDAIRIRYDVSFDSTAIKDLIKDLLKGIYSPERNVVFSAFPSRHEQYNYDVRQIMDSAIARYGSEEWKACVITDEFHGHLGVFSIVGAKMGIRAREIFGVGPDILQVVSYAGTKPPYSCLNDGIQVSTGATLGQGTITVSSDSMTMPQAVFSYNGKSVKIKLKDEYLKVVNSDIQQGIVKFGLMDDGYWKLVRRSALRYWLEWDRNKIFEISIP
jgi:inosine-uridine nucleoside N-ribohydrolase/formylmethanofuran dehydrogenase subunit E